jgi:hypothetical protein
MEQFPAGSPLVEAAIADAARVARGAEIVSRAAPWRRPRGLGLAAALAGVTVIAALWPATRPSAAPLVNGRAARPRTPVDPRQLAADRTAARTAAQEAMATNDAELARLARELERVLDGLAEGQLEQADALEKLARLAREAAQASEEGRASAELLKAAADALEREKQTRALGEAMREPEEGAAKKAAEELAQKASKMPDGQRERVAQALAKAGAPAQSSESPAGEERRRLNAPSGAGQGQQGASDRERRLKRLERDLEDSAEQCRADPEACQKALEQLGADLPDVSRDARQSSARDKLGRSMQQLRERLKRQNQGENGGGEAEESFERSAGGMRTLPAPGAGGTQAEQQGAQGTPGGSSAQAAGEAAAAAGTGAGAGEGEGMGTEEGSDPLGSRERPTGTRGQQHEARLRDGAGPSRAEVIEAGAHKGFARSEYQRVFQDYSAVVEETLDTTAVPPARRYLVRRYFQLIRPREAPEAPRGR